MIDFHFTPRHDAFSFAGFIVFGWWGVLKAPWNIRVFSERHGFEKFRRLGFGWRWQIRRIRQIIKP